jgi:alanine racemase
MAVGDPRRVSRTRTGETAVAVPVDARSRPVWAEIDVGAVRHNAGLLRKIAAPAALCAVVKADAYGHGAVAVARAALDGGATWLAVATPDEGVELRDGGVLAPVLVLSEPPAEAMADVVAHGLTPAVYSRPGVSALAEASAGAGTVTDVHVKVDTGMHRVGAGRDDLLGIVAAVAGAPSLRFAALWTHFPVADGVDREDRTFTEAQIAALGEARDALVSAGYPPPLLHAANSAGALAYPGSRLDVVRCGIALYGVCPFPVLDAVAAGVVAATGADGLRPVLSLRSKVTLVRRLDAGERPSYGRLHALGERSTVATVPLGYADGIPRRYFTRGGTVLVGGRRRPLAGMVTMDQIVVECGSAEDNAVGDDVVLIGGQGAESLTAAEWADVLGTIAHEVFCGIGPRVPRVVVDREGLS